MLPTIVPPRSTSATSQFSFPQTASSHHHLEKIGIGTPLSHKFLYLSLLVKLAAVPQCPAGSPTQISCVHGGSSHVAMNILSISGLAAHQRKAPITIIIQYSICGPQSHHKRGGLPPPANEIEKKCRLRCQPSPLSTRHR